MIRLTRTRTKAAIPPAFRGPNRLTWALELLQRQRAILLALEAGQELKHTFEASRWKGVKNQLFAEANNKCAYCEANTRVVAYGDVEHFRPKSKYWWLAYCYDNYVVACAVCNQRYKSDYFPILTGNQPMAGPVVLPDSTNASLISQQAYLFPDPLEDAKGLPMLDFEHLHQGERPLLLNPYVDDPDDYFAWQAHDDLKQVWLVPANEAAEPFVAAAEDYYGLNRTELKDLRYQRYLWLKTYHRLLAQATHLPDSTKVDIQQAIDSLLADNADFAGMLRYFHRKWLLTPP